MPRKTATQPSPLGSAYADPTNTFGPRTRFNWGYHDGASCAKSGSDRTPSSAYDLPYAVGHDFGRNEFYRGEYTENSDAAWKAFVAASTPERIADMHAAEVAANLAYYPKKQRTPEKIAAIEACTAGYGL